MRDFSGISDDFLDQMIDIRFRLVLNTEAMLDRVEKAHAELITERERRRK